MKVIRNLLLLSLISLFIVSNVKAQDSDVPERLKYYKEKYEEVFDAPFVTVWNSIKEVIAATGCQLITQKYAQTDEGYYKGTIKTDYCVFASGIDSSYKLCQTYQVDMPYIPGSDWVSGRINYKIVLKEMPDGKVSMTLTSEMSGYESKITYKVHFWKSNGMLEHQIIEDFKKKIEANKSK